MPALITPCEARLGCVRGSAGWACPYHKLAHIINLPADINAYRMVRQVIEVSLHDFDDRRDEIAQQLFSAAKDVGFFYISGGLGTALAVLGRFGRPSARVAPHLAMARWEDYRNRASW